MNQRSNHIANTERRDFLKISLGLALLSSGGISMMSLASAEASGTLNAYVNINADGSRSDHVLMMAMIGFPSQSAPSSPICIARDL